MNDSKKHFLNLVSSFESVFDFSIEKFSLNCHDVYDSNKFGPFLKNNENIFWEQRYVAFMILSRASVNTYPYKILGH